jgi:DNA polymerase-3 subunit delta
MVALKPGQIDRLLAEPARLPPVVLVFGPDVGLVAERAAAIVKAASGAGDDPFSLVRLDGADVVADPARLSDEARTIALFGGRRTVWVRDAGTRPIEPAVVPLLDDPPVDAVVVIEAGDLKKGGLRKRVEDHPVAAAIACYADAAADLDRLIDEEARLAGLAVDEEARAALHLLLGADRRLSRGEVAKLCLYAHGRGRIGAADVEAVVGDAAASGLDDVVDAALTGDLVTLDRDLARLFAAGASASTVLGAMLRQLQALIRARIAVDEGATPTAAVDRMVPPVFFRRKPAVARALSLWPGQRLDTAAARVDDAVAETRRLPGLAAEITGNVLMALATAARAEGRARGR